MTADRWHLKGDYFENCNCEVLCPCILPVPSAVPTEGYCDVGLAFHIDEGDFNGVPLGGLNFVLAAHTPGTMSEGNWTTALYVDERASGQQREALGRILSGQVGGPPARWMGLTTDVKGVKYCPISYSAQGRKRSVVIPEIMDFNVEGIVAGRRRAPMRLENTGHPVNSTLALARGTASTYSDHGMVWDNTGKNGHYAPFDWNWP